MRLASIVLVVAASIFACCEGASAVSDSKGLIAPLNNVQTENNGNRLLRVHQDEEERGGPQLSKSLSEKLFTNAAAKLTRSKSLNDLVKLDDVAHLKDILGKNDAIFLRIENKGFNPDGMLLRMKELGDIDLQLLKHYTKYWMAKYPNWVSKLEG
ncbi:hypothetical protein P3T76_010291 [Phytophthora citrophthora]|uniref:RxLR effector protein n=1 Tax=Phytophthora citrophthora TaxID=4793 RepID=A0AAD9GC22_9STRA|nr:hypothetical protein P3T76_010291 [Phytophthora citrophthora]